MGVLDTRSDSWELRGAHQYGGAGGILVLYICTVLLVKGMRLNVGLGREPRLCKARASLIWYDPVFIGYLEVEKIKIF